MQRVTKTPDDYACDVNKLVAAGDWGTFIVVWINGAGAAYDEHQARFVWRGCTVLQLAMVRRAPRFVVERLLTNPDAARASINCCGLLPDSWPQGRTPLELLIANEDWLNGWPGLRYSLPYIPWNQVDIAQLLIANGAKQTPATLHLAVRRGASLELMHVLLAAETKYRAWRDAWGRRPVDLARSRRADARLVQMLMPSAADEATAPPMEHLPLWKRCCSPE
jgi:hypothetical protein